MKKGEVWRVRMPQVPGHTQFGERPAIIMQEDYFNKKLPTVLIIPFTSTLQAANLPGTLLVQPNPHNGLTLPSIALVFQLSALDRQNCVIRLGELDSANLDKVFDLLDDLMGR
jgi:mRNA interferase MazF